jgi:hypothetical protein
MATKKRKAPLWSWTAVVAVYIGLAAFFLVWDRQKLTPERMESLIAADLRPGIDCRQVGQWATAIARRGADRGCLHVAATAYTLPSEVVIPARTKGIDTQAIASVIALNVPAARLNLLSSEDMFVYFFFDADCRLLGHHIALRRMKY